MPVRMSVNQIISAVGKLAKTVSNKAHLDKFLDIDAEAAAETELLSETEVKASSQHSLESTLLRANTP